MLILNRLSCEIQTAPVKLQPRKSVMRWFAANRLMHNLDGPVMASKSPTEATPDRTAIPPIAEVRRPMVRFHRVWSARPLAADDPWNWEVRQFVTQTGLIWQPRFSQSFEVVLQVGRTCEFLSFTPRAERKVGLNFQCLGG